MKMRQLSSSEINQVSGAVLDFSDPGVAQRYSDFGSNIIETAKKRYPEYASDVNMVLAIITLCPDLREAYVGWENRAGEGSVPFSDLIIKAFK